MIRFCSIRHFRSRQEKETIRSGNGKIDFSNLDISRCEEVAANKRRLFGLKSYSKSLKRFIKVVVWYPVEDDMTKWQIYFNTYESMSTKDVINCYRTRFQ